MTIVVKSDVVMDECVFLMNASGRSTRQNDRSVNQGGYGTVNVVRDVTLSQYIFGAKPMSVEAWREVEGVYEDTDAGAYGFLIKDPSRHSVTVTDGALQGYMAGVQFGTTGFGNGTPLYILGQLTKPQSTSRTRFRVRTRPNGTPSVFRGGSPVTVGVAAGNISFSSGPVYVTFVPDATRTIDSVTVGATTQVNLSSAITGLVIGGRLWLQGLTGADAALLNNLSHQITNIASDVYTLATNTAGKTITVGAGAAHKYPQPDESLRWAGQFYVPVHFATDDLDWDVVLGGDVDDRLIAGPSVTLMEVREA